MTGGLPPAKGEAPSRVEVPAAPRTSEANWRDVFIAGVCLAIVLCLMVLLPLETRYVPLIGMSVLAAAIVNLVLIRRV